MFKLYLSKGSSAIAAHMLLEDIGAQYQIEEVSIPKGQHQSPEFLKVNPKGRVPVLATSEGLLTENPAILEYIAAAHPDADLIPSGAYAQGQARALCAYICATAHVAFAHKQRGARWADGQEVHAAMAARVPGNIADCAAFLETQLQDGPWALGARYRYCDPYLYLIGQWMAACEIEISDYPKLAAHRTALRARAATKTVLEFHGLP